MGKLAIEDLCPANLVPYRRNARTHSRKQIRQIADSIRIFGFTNPVLIDSRNAIIAGHCRVEAAKLLGMTSVPCVRHEHMSSAQKRAYIIADNKLALNAGWDEEILATELQFLVEAELDFDVSVTGFSPAEIDLLIEGLEPEEAGDPADDELPAINADEPPVSAPGDLWILGEHRLLCADATSGSSFDRQLDGNRAQMVFTDPPYNVPIRGHVSGLGKVRHREFPMAAGEMSKREFVDFLTGAFGHLRDHSVDGSIHFICMDWRHIGEMTEAGEAVYTELKNLIVWAKDSGGMGTFYRSRHELIFAFKSGTAPHVNTFELGQHGRYRTNVWQYRGVNSFKSGRMEELGLHPTVKPVAMIADAIKDVSQRGGIVVDCFGGSGSTLIAAYKTGRRAYLIELDPLYVDRTIRRWQGYAKDDAVHAETGETFDAVVSRRLQAKPEHQP